MPDDLIIITNKATGQNSMKGHMSYLILLVEYLPVNTSFCAMH